MKNTIIYILEQIKKLFPNGATTELKFGNPFEMVISIILSAQSTDKQVNKVTDFLYKFINHPKQILNLKLSELEFFIKSIGLYNSKAKYIYKLSEIIIDLDYIKKQQPKLELENSKQILVEYGYLIPDSLNEIIKLPGVGEKTGKLILNLLYNLNYIPVDTHIHRVSNRLGIVNTKYPRICSIQLEKIIPFEYKQSSHHYLLFFGRYYCKARNPLCENCVLIKVCSYYKKLIG